MKKRRNDLPFNHEAEMIVLGSTMTSNEALYKVLSSIEEEDFYEGKHQLIYRAIVSLNNKRVDIEIYTVTEELMLMNALDDIGGVDYLKSCLDIVVAISAIDFYINIVKDNANLRNLLNTIRDINDDYLSNELDSIEDFIKQSEERIRNVTVKNRVSSFKTIETITNEAVLQIYNQKNSGDGFTTGITSGYSNVNRFTNGFQRGEVTIVGARTSVGKTSLALNMAYKAAMNGTMVAIFELEMTAESLAKRMIAMASNVSLNKIMTGNLSDIDRVKVTHASEEIMSLPIFIDDGPNSLIDIETKCRQLIEKYPELGLIVVDHMSIVKVVGGKKSDSRVDEMRKISQGLHALAKDLDIAILAVAQLNRDSVKGEVKRPKMVDIKESGAIEQDADVILLLYDPLYENNRIKKNNNNLPEDVRHIEVIVAKQRNGNTGIADLIFYKQFCRFEIPSDEWQREIAAMRNEN